MLVLNYTLTAKDSKQWGFDDSLDWDLGVYTLGVYILGVYTLGSTLWGSTLWWSRESRTTDFGNLGPHTGLGVYTLGVYTLEVYTLGV